MRFIPTFDSRVEELKKRAKRLRNTGGGKHADLLNRVARGAGYDHWHHVIECHKLTTAKRGAEGLLAECAAIREAELRGEIKVVMTGPNVDSQIGPFVLFSTGIGDAWLLDPEESLAASIMWRGQPSELEISETPRQIRIDWEAKYELLGAFMRIEAIDTRIESRAIAGYPLDAVRQVIDRALSVHKKIASVIGQEDAIDLTDAVIADLVRHGWEESQLREQAAQGFRYSPGRNSLLGPVLSSDDEDWDDESFR